MTHSITASDIVNRVKLHLIPVTNRGPGKPRQPVFVRSCLLYAYKDNRNGPRGRPRFIGGSGFSVRRAATATPPLHPFFQEEIWKQ